MDDLCNLTIGFVISFMVLLFPRYIEAHKVNIFVYTEGDKVYTESYFNDGKPCMDSVIEVFSMDDTELMRGRTDKDGLFEFPLPQGSELRIVLNAGMGHRAEYTLDIPGTGDQENYASKKDEIKDHTIGEEKDKGTIPSDMNEVRKMIEDTVDRSLEKHMRPLIRAVSKIEKDRVSLTEVFGGIGYIFGIMGIILYFKKREK